MLKPLILPATLLVPRVFATYPVYLLPTLARLASRGTQFRQHALFLMLLVAASIAVNAGNTDFAVGNALLQITLMAPLLTFCLTTKPGPSSDIPTIVYINVGIAVLSLMNLTAHGFPQRIPYLSMPPDYYSALYGLGGAKIVCLLGFLGIISHPKSLVTRAICWANFLAPGYLIGIACGLSALGVKALLTQPKLITKVGIVIASIIALHIISGNERSSQFEIIVGEHPKTFAYSRVLDVYQQQPMAIFIGAGPGQFTGEPAIWTSPYLGSHSKHNIPSLPLAHSTNLHKDMFYELLHLPPTARWATASSINKPYTSISTLLIEFGILFTCVLLTALYKAIWSLALPRSTRLTLLVFIASLFLIDNHLENIWLFSTLLFLGHNSNDSIET